MTNYYFSPIGDETKRILDDYDGSGWRIPHSRDTHGIGKIDWDLGNESVPIYSMTDGVLSSISCGDSQGNQGYMVCIVSDRKDKNGYPIVINYLELEGLAGQVAEKMEVEDNPSTEAANAGKRVSCYDEGIQIKMGEQIGYSNTFYSGSNVHIDFTYNDRFNGSYTPPSGAPSYDGDNYDSTPQTKNNDFFNEHKEDLFKGRDKVPNSTGGDTIYSYSPYISHMVMCQKPAYLSGTSSSGANYEDISTLLDRAKDWRTDKSDIHNRVWKKLGSKEALNRARVVYNAFCSNFNGIQAAAIAANGLSENTVRCLSNISDDGKTYDCDWGFGTDGINSQTDGGWFAFHPWKDKLSMLKKILKSLGISDSCLNSEKGGTAEVQIAIYNEIFSQSDIGKVYGLSNRSISSVKDINGNDITSEVQEGIGKFVSGGLQTYTGDSATACCAIFERGFEGSDLSVNDSPARFWSAACLYEIFTGQETT